MQVQARKEAQMKKTEADKSMDKFINGFIEKPNLELEEILGRSTPWPK